MAKPRCDQHKRSLPYCDACKEAVRVAEEATLQAERNAVDEDAEAEDNQKHNVLEEALREEESKALAEGIGFPGTQEEVPEAGEPVEGDEPITDPWADGKTPEEGQDVGDWVPPEERVTPRADIDETEEAMTETGEFDFAPAVEIDGDGNIVPVQNLDSPVENVKDLIDATEAALAEGEPDTPGDDPFPKATAAWKAYEEKLRRDGRKEVIGMVREYFADGIDTVAFQLLEYLEKACR